MLSARHLGRTPWAALVGAALTGLLLLQGVAACGSGGGSGSMTATVAAGSGHRFGTPGAEGLGDPYYPKHGNAGYDVASYQIENTIDFRPARLTKGTTTIVATATQDLSRFNLDFSLEVDAVRVNGTLATFARSADELVVTPSRGLRRGSTFTTRVRYHSNSTPPGWSTTQQEILATGEPEVAQWWFPSNDSPLDAATYDVKIDVPSGREGVSVGRLLGQQTSGGRTVWHWAAREPMASYVSFFAAGGFDLRSETVAGVRYTYAVSKALASSVRDTNMTLLRQTPALVAALSDDYGPYPYVDGGGLVTSTFRTEDWAMENQTRPTYPAMKNGVAARKLMVHELGHQWFGDHVRPQRWRDIANNEGFARWSEMRWSEQNQGISANVALEAMYGEHPAGDSFWVRAIDDPGRGHLFEWEVYDRGAMMIQALRNKLGDPLFFTLVRQWVAQYGAHTARVCDFETLATTVSAQDLDDFFEVWLRNPEKPAHTAANGFRVP